MKKIVLFFMLGLAISGTAQAQTRDTIKGRGFGKEHRQAVVKDLNLTAEQKAAAQANREKFKTDLKAINENNSLTPEQKKEARKEAQQRYMTTLQSMLTPEQKAQVQQGRKEAGKGRAAGAKKDSLGRKGKLERKAEARRMQQELNLTTEQQTKMKTLNADFKAEAKTIKENTALSNEEKKQKLLALHKQRKTSMQTVLTPAQIEKRKSLAKESKAKRKVK